jgi:hypothetical protein
MFLLVMSGNTRMGNPEHGLKLLTSPYWVPRFCSPPLCVWLGSIPRGARNKRIGI